MCADAMLGAYVYVCVCVLVSTQTMGTLYNIVVRGQHVATNVAYGVIFLVQHFIFSVKRRQI